MTGQLPQHLVDQLAAGYREMGGSRDVALGAAHQMTILLRELATKVLLMGPPPSADHVATMRVDDVRDWITAHRDNLQQLLEALPRDPKERS